MNASWASAEEMDDECFESSGLKVLDESCCSEAPRATLRSELLLKAAIWELEPEVGPEMELLGVWFGRKKREAARGSRAGSKDDSWTMAREKAQRSISCGKEDESG